MRGDDHRVFICPATLRADIFDVSTLSLDPFPSSFCFFFFLFGICHELHLAYSAAWVHL